MARLAVARAVALACLMEAEEYGRYVRDVLDSSPRVRALSLRDAGFARRLALGSTSARGCLDELLDQCLDKPNRVSPRVRMALRISTFELLYLSCVPEVAVSQGVELVRSVAKGAAGLANAVLRQVDCRREAYLAAADLPETERALGSAARSCGLPLWLMGELEASLGAEGARAVGAGTLEPAPFALHLSALADLEGSALPALTSRKPSPLPGAVVPLDAAAAIASGVLADGRAVASDLHAQLVATAAVRPGSCLEVGAGRGTKTFVMMSQMRRAGFAGTLHVALDLSPERCAANRRRLEQAGIGGVRVLEGDGRALDRALAALDAETGERLLFDTVLVDAPCSGTGTMRRHPEIPWRLDRDDVHRALPELQGSLLRCAAERVAPGGELLYATCSVLRQENDHVVEAFLASPAGSGFTVAPVSKAVIFSLPGYDGAGASVSGCETPQGCFQSIPVRGGFDGHFCARLRRSR